MNPKLIQSGHVIDPLESYTKRDHEKQSIGFRGVSNNGPSYKKKWRAELIMKV